MIQTSCRRGVRKQSTFLPSVGGTERSGNAALRSCTGLVQAVEQTSPELVSSLQGQVTLSQIFFFEPTWVGETSLYQSRAPQPCEGD